MLNVVELLRVAYQAAYIAAKSVCRIYYAKATAPVEKGTGVDPITKNPMKDTQTLADVTSEVIICEILSRKFPLVRVVAEEGLTLEQRHEYLAGMEATDLDLSDSQVPDNLRTTGALARLLPCFLDPRELVIYVDPVDGTNEFCRSEIECVSILIGICHGGVPYAGVIYRPFPNSKFPEVSCYGIRDFGAWFCHQDYPSVSVRLQDVLARQSIEKRRLALGFTPPVENSMFICTARSRSHKCIDGLLKAIEQSHAVQVLRESGAGHKLLLVILGLVDVYLYTRPGTKKWDTAAGDAILRVMNSSVRDSFGRPVCYWKEVSEGNKVTNTDENMNGIIACRDNETSEYLTQSCLPVLAELGIRQDDKSSWMV